MDERAFSYYMHDGPTGFTIELAGTMDTEGPKKVERHWPSDGGLIDKKERLVDLTLVTPIDPAERRLLHRWLKNAPNIDFNQPVRLALWSRNGQYRVCMNDDGIVDQRDYHREIDGERVSSRRAA